MGNLRKLFVTALISASAISAYAQRTCGSMDVLERQMAQDPKLARTMQAIETHTQGFAANQLDNPNARTSVSVTIPVVFHVIYNNSTENISDTRLNEQLAVLNQDFRKLNTDLSLVPSAWQGITADCEINFCLATVDPTGAATTGITRTSSTVTAFSDNDAMKFTAQGGKNIWDRNKYLNIWVCDLGGDLLGYAQFPGGTSTTDGVVLDYAYTGKTGATAPFNKGRTGTHEVGHWLNLYHIWGDDDGACTGSDGASDTPNQADASGGCPSGTVTDGCTASSPGIMWMNYMDYTNDACMYMFTAGQKARVQALFATGGSRVSLLTSNGCGGTPPPPGYCASNGQSVADEWIQSVAFGPINNVSGANGGYGNFTGTTYNVTRGTSYSFTLTPGFSGSTYPEYWKIWIDYNRDNDFADAGELVYDAGTTSTAARTGSVTISSSASTGTTRMRVSMKYNGAQTECESFSYGEVEDYTLNIQAAVACATPTGLNVTSITTSSATLGWTSSGATSYNVRYKPTSSSTWTPTTSTTNSKAISGLTAGTTYEFQVQGVCSGSTSVYSGSVTFTTSAAGCTDIYEANESLAAAKPIAVNTNIFAKICTTTDKDWFRCTTTTTLPKLRVTLSGLVADYDVKLYNSAGTQIGISQNGGTTSETITYNTPTAGAVYYIQVYGYNGANSTTQYTLRASAQATNWARIDPNSVSPFNEDKDLTAVEVFPNPASQLATVRFNAGVDAKVSVQLMDMTGKFVSVRTIDALAGDNDVEFDLSALANGLYLVRLEMNGKVITRRLDVAH